MLSQSGEHTVNITGTQVFDSNTDTLCVINPFLDLSVLIFHTLPSAGEWVYVNIHLDLIHKINTRAVDELYANANVLTEHFSMVRAILAFNLFIFQNHSRKLYISVSVYPNLFLPKCSVPLVDRRNLGLRAELRSEWLRTFIWSFWLTTIAPHC